MNKIRQQGFTLIELGLALLILILTAFVVLSILNSNSGRTTPTGTSFTVRGDWLQAPTVIGSNEAGEIIYKEEIAGNGVPGITIIYEIEGSNHVLILSTLSNSSSAYDTSVNPPIETTSGEITTDASGEALLKLSALSDGGVTVKAFAIDGAGDAHEDPVVKQMEIDTDPNATTRYTP